MKILNQTNKNIVADKVSVANNIITRFIGLLNRSKFNKGEGLLITPCNSIHSIGMKFKFDAVFLDKKNEVKYLIKEMESFKLSPVVISAHSVLELPSGTIDFSNIRVGDVLELIKD